MNRALFGIGWLWSELVSIVVRVDHTISRLATPPVQHHRGACPFCGATLGAAEQRPPRVTRQPNGGKIKQLPGEILSWRACTGCTRYQVGELRR